MKKTVLLFALITCFIISTNVFAEIKNRQTDFSSGYCINTSNFVLKQDILVPGFNLKFSHHRKVHEQFALGAHYEMTIWNYFNEKNDYYERYPLIAFEQILTLRQFPNWRLSSGYLYAECGIGFNFTVVKFELGPEEDNFKTDFSPAGNTRSRGYFQPVVLLGIGARYPLLERLEFTLSPQFHIYRIQKDNLWSTCSFLNLNLGIAFLSKN